MFINFKTSAVLAGLLLSGILGGLACVSEKEPSAPASSAGRAVPPTASPQTPSNVVPGLDIYPITAERSSVLSAAARGFDINHAHVSWNVDGATISGDGTLNFSCAEVRRGSSVTAQAVVDGQLVQSNSVVIGNSLPKLTKTTLLPENSGQGESLKIEAFAEDLDEDPVTISYAWTVNGSPAGNSAKLDRAVKRGDSVRVEVTPNDGQASGAPVVMAQDIVNSPPAIIDHRNFAFDGRTYTYQVQAKDPDGDSLAYSLEAYDPTITIQPATGTIVWKVPSDFAGDKEVTVIADDGHGGKTRYIVTFTVR